MKTGAKTQFQWTLGLALCLGTASILAEPVPNHLVFEDDAPAAVGQNTPGRTREDKLVEGLKEADLDPRALEMLERVFRNTPRVGQGEFANALNQLSGQNKDLFKPGQVEDLKKLFGETLAKVNGEPGKELTQAMRKVLQELKAPVNPQGAQAAAEPQAAGAGGIDLATLALLKEFMGGDKEANAGADVRPLQNPVLPPPAPLAAAGRDRGDDRKRDANREADRNGRDRNRFGGGGYPQMQAPDSKDKNEDKKPEDKKPGSGSDYVSKSKPPLVPEEDDKPKSPSPSKESLLDALNNVPVDPAPKMGPALSPIQDSGLASMALGGMGTMPPMMGQGMAGVGGMGGFGFGGGVGGFVSPSSSLSDDVFRLDDGMASGPAPGGYTFLRDVGYSSSGDPGESYSSEGSVGDEDSSIGGQLSRISAYADQIDMTPAKVQGRSLVEKRVGSSLTSLCASEVNSKDVGLCEGLVSRKLRAAQSTR